MVLVLLGPTAELHSGIHGGLCDHPPTGVTYLQPPHRHRFAFASPRPQDPFHAPSLLEAIDYGLPTALEGVVAGVHCSRLPAWGGIPWVADTDDLILTLAYGRPLVRGVESLPDLHSEVVLQRAARMTAAYAAPECVGVLLRTERARAAAAAYLTDLPLLTPRVRDALISKLDVVRVGFPPMSPPTGGRRHVSVTYMGRSYADKGGPIAARVFRALSGTNDERLRLVWVGPSPDEVRRSLPSVEFRELMPRAQFMEVLAGTDIFLSPTRYESFGAALAEAAANSCVLLTTSGPGMQHIEEVFREGQHGYFVSSQQADDRQATEYVSKVGELLAHPQRMRQIQEANWALTTAGALSLPRRDTALGAYYEKLSRLHRGPEGTVHAGSWLSLSGEEMMHRYAGYRDGPRRRVLGVHPAGRGGSLRRRRGRPDVAF